MKRLLCAFCILSLIDGCRKDVKPQPKADFTYEIIYADLYKAIVDVTNTSKNYNHSTLETKECSRIDQDPIVNNGDRTRLVYTDNCDDFYRLTVSDGVTTDTKTVNVSINNINRYGTVIFYTTVADKGAITLFYNEPTVLISGIITQPYTKGIPKCGEKGEGVLTVLYYAEENYSYTAKTEGPSPLTWKGSYRQARGECKIINLSRETAL